MLNIRRLCVAILGGAFLLGDANASPLCEVWPTPDFVVDPKRAGAIGDGSTDDTKALQKALNEVPVDGGTVMLTAGIYLVDATVGLRIKDNTIFKLSQGAVIKAIPNEVGSYSILRIYNASNVAIVGGVLEGERHEHRGSSGEWGMGLSLHRARNVIIKNVTSKNNWGDGFYVGGESNNIRFCAVVADGNRRQGLSIVSGTRILVTDSVFKNTKGVPPQAGIDIEPNDAEAVKDVRIFNSRFSGNSGSGVASYFSTKFKNGSISSVLIDGNSFVENGGDAVAFFNTSDAKVIGNNFKKNRKRAIFFDEKSRATIEQENVVVH